MQIQLCESSKYLMIQTLTQSASVVYEEEESP